MKADILRLILFLAGVALVLGIYLADRFRRNREERYEERRVVDSDLFQQDSDPVKPEKRREPLWSAEDSVKEEVQEEIATEEVEIPILDEPLEPIVKKRSRDRSGFSGEQISLPFLSEKRRHEARPERKKELPDKIIQINIVPRKGVSLFSGDDILCVVAELNLEYGEMDIYHRYRDNDGAGATLFSLANMVHPGTFPIAAMDEFTTPGLTLFAILPGPLDGLSLFSEMLSVAEKLATLLDGTLQDESHSDLSKQTIEHMRQEIQEYHRQLQLARSKR
jgi:cell division protein ZipA